MKREKAKEWARKNKDRIKEINKRYWLKKAKEKLAEEKLKREE
ncbi:MAG: phosphatase [Clostridiales bacterium]|nr:phosphatase [Clostridiales bacterium]